MGTNSKYEVASPSASVTVSRDIVEIKALISYLREGLAFIFDEKSSV